MIVDKGLAGCFEQGQSRKWNFKQPNLAQTAPLPRQGFLGGFAAKQGSEGAPPGRELQ